MVREMREGILVTLWAMMLPRAKRSFAVCTACHQIGENAKIAVGPVPNGVIGRRAGTYPGYSYSDTNSDLLAYLK